LKGKIQVTVVGLMSVHPPGRRLLLAAPVPPNSLHIWLAAPSPEIPARLLPIAPEPTLRTRILTFMIISHQTHSSLARAFIDRFTTYFL